MSLQEKGAICLVRSLDGHVLVKLSDSPAYQKDLAALTEGSAAKSKIRRAKGKGKTGKDNAPIPLAELKDGGLVAMSPSPEPSVPVRTKKRKTPRDSGERTGPKKLKVVHVPSIPQPSVTEPQTHWRDPINDNTLGAANPTGVSIGPTPLSIAGFMIPSIHQQSDTNLFPYTQVPSSSDAYPGTVGFNDTPLSAADLAFIATYSPNLGETGADFFSSMDLNLLNTSGTF